MYFSYLLLYLVLVGSEILTKYDKSKDKLILKPVELIDLILEERLRKEAHLPDHRKVGVKTNSQLCVEEVTEPVCINHGSSKDRKVWSRWSKWSECSASCGTGATERRRVCVSGRCARGELELQRRPCQRQPCSKAYDHDAMQQEVNSLGVARY